MIDLKVNQIVEPAVEAWFRNYDNEKWERGRLLFIDHRNEYPFEAQWFKCKQCSLTDPNIPILTYQKQDHGKRMANV